MKRYDDITDFFAYENTATFDRVRKLRWNNGTLIKAIYYYNTVYKRKITYDELLNEISSGSIEYILSLLFGALSEADEHITITDFTKLYQEQHLKEYIRAVYDGMNHYLSEPEVKDTGEGLDPAWPDTQAELKKKTTPTELTGDIGSGQRKASSVSHSRKSKKQP